MVRVRKKGETLTKKGEWLFLLAITSVISMLFLDGAAIPIALSTAQKDLSLSSVGLQWVMSAYSLASASFVIAGGRISDLIGHRKGLYLGMMIFGVASIIGGSASGEVGLIASRALQGLGGAIMVPSALSLLLDHFPEDKRGRAMAITSGMGSIFLSAGPFIGGIATQFFSWRVLFWVNLPIIAISVILTSSIIPPSEKIKGRFDTVGCLSLCGSFSSLIIGITQGGEWGWTSPLILSLFALSALFGCILLINEKFVEHPFIDFSLIRRKKTAGKYMIAFLMQFIATYGVFLPMFFQQVLFYSPLRSGIVMLFSSLSATLLSPLGGFLNDWKGAKLPVLIGSIALILSALCFSLFTADRTGYWECIALLFFGMGLSYINTPLSIAVMSTTTSSKSGMAYGMYNTIRFAGSTVGIAALGAVRLSMRSWSFHQLLEESPGLKSVDVEKTIEGFTGESAFPGEVENLSHTLFDQLKEIFVESSFASFSLLNLLMGVFAMGLFALALNSLQFKSKKLFPLSYS